MSHSHTQLLIVHPDPSTRALMASMLRTLGHEIVEAACDRTAVRMIEQVPPALVLAAVEPADPDALEMLGYLRRKHPEVRTILLFPGPHPERTRDALQRGAVSVLRFPVPANHLRAAVAQALEEAERPAACRNGSGSTNGNVINGYSQANSSTNGHTEPLHRSLLNGLAQAAGSSGSHVNGSKTPEFPVLIGDDPSLRQTVELAAIIAQSKAPILIVGERGTGKSALARLLHLRGGRAEGPFVEVACGAFKEAALEAEPLRRAGDGGPDRLGKASQATGARFIWTRSQPSPRASGQALPLDSGW